MLLKKTAVVLLRMVAVFGFTVFNCSAQTDTLIIQGVYQEENLFVQNPFATIDSTRFCTEKVNVNGQSIGFIQASAFEIDLKTMGLTYGQTIIIEIIHKEECRPKILNTTRRPRDTSEISSIEVRPDSVLTWTTRSESHQQIFYIEQYVWNKWITVGEMGGLGSATTGHTYEFQVTLHSGHNLFRVKQQTSSQNWIFSETARFLNNNRPLTILEIDKRTITLSGETRYELYDAAGNMLKKGVGSFIDCSNLPKGTYYLNYDNKTEVVHFKKVKTPKDEGELPLH